MMKQNFDIFSILENASNEFFFFLQPKYMTKRHYLSFFKTFYRRKQHPVDATYSYNMQRPAAGATLRFTICGVVQTLHIVNICSVGLWTLHFLTFCDNTTGAASDVTNVIISVRLTLLQRHLAAAKEQFLAAEVVTIYNNSIIN